MTVENPGRFTQVTTWKGPVDVNFINTLKEHYGKSILEMGRSETPKTK